MVFGSLRRWRSRLTKLLNREVRISRLPHCRNISMSPEIPRQKNMFTGEWDDARSAKQRQLDYERELTTGTQLPMFGQSDLSEDEDEAGSVRDTVYQVGKSE